MLQHLVDWVAPRSALDFVVKLFVVNIVMLALYITQEWAIDGWPPNGWGNHVRAVLIMSVPASALSLVLIGHLHKLQSQLAELAARDMLTGLLNRRGFIDVVAADGRMGEAGLLILADVDHFKRVNDTYGHAVGDLCLKAISRFLASKTRLSDHVARFGGEEFVVFLPGAAVSRIQDLGAALADGVEVRLDAKDAVLRLTLSGGAVEVVEGADLDRVLMTADAALYRAKSAGRARVVVAERAA